MGILGMVMYRCELVTTFPSVCLVVRLHYFLSSNACTHQPDAQPPIGRVEPEIGRVVLVDTMQNDAPEKFLVSETQNTSLKRIATH